jgi:hypothetical protein
MSPPLDISGLPYGRLTAMSRCDSAGRQGSVWDCKCSCGRWAKVRLKDLTNGNTASCGCLRGEVARTYGAPASKVVRVDNARKITFDGVTDTLSGWSRRLGISMGCINWRRRHGWPEWTLLMRPGVKLQDLLSVGSSDQDAGGVVQ